MLSFFRNKNKLVLIITLLIIAIISFIFSNKIYKPINAQTQATYYISPTGSDTVGNGTYNNPWATFSYSYSRMQGGDTLIVKNGTYRQQSVMHRSSYQISPPSGTSSAYTTIRAESDGAAIIDGEGVMSPISIGGEPFNPIHHIQFIGLVFRHQAGGAGLYGVQYLKFLRCGFEDSCQGNCATVSVSGRNTNTSFILFGDCYAWGSGRYKFLTYHANNIILRRCVVRFDRTNTIHDGRTEPIGGFSIYASDKVELQNCISIDGDHSEFWLNPSDYCGSYCIPSTDGPTTNLNMRGCMALNVGMQFGGLTKNLDNINIDNCLGWHIREGVWARDSANYNHCTFGDIYGGASYLGVPNTGLHFYPGDDPVNSINIRNSILYNIKGTALTSFNSEDYNVFYGNNQNYQNTPQGSHSISNQNPNLKYITRIENNNSLLKGTGSDSGDRGANIAKRWGVSGTLWGEPGYNSLTTEDLWPWPYEDIIKNLMKSYSYTGPTISGATSTLSGNRGFAADGNGLYGGPITLTSYIWEYLGNPCPDDICSYGSIPEPEPEPDPIVPPSIILTKQVSESQTQSGDTLTYTLTYQNTSAVEAKNIIITDNIPEGATYIETSATNGGIYNLGANELTWTIPSLSAGASGQVSFQAKVD